jgi:hypothetical protein
MLLTAGTMRRAAVGFIWLALLLLTIPAFSTTWSFGGASSSVAWLLAQPPGLAYLGFCGSSRSPLRARTATWSAT